ncbi:MAG: FtsQ-type POTRA domain-containing protein [Candidatus Moranbacteria bacterium]|nr:FtsQ-type POTRA domain-containing protein [Candidatus Moranbacteria bacterium]
MVFWRNRKKDSKKILLRKSTREFPRRSFDDPPRFLKVLYYILLMLFLGVTVYVFFFSSFLQVKSFAIKGIKSLPSEEVLRKITSPLEGNYLGFVPRNNLVLISEEKLKSDLSRQFRRIKSVEIKKSFPDLLAINIEERVSLVLWCSGGPCYLVDEQGYAYNNADLDSPEVTQNNLIRLVDISAQPVNIGERLLSSEYLNFVIAAREALKKELGIELSDEFQTRSRFAEEIQIETSEGWKAYLSSQLPLNQSVRTLKTFLEEEVDSSKRGRLEYVDLRVNNKVYYKMKEEDKSQNVSEDKSEDKKGKSEE